MGTSVLLSIRPRFAEAILSGAKQFELRRRFPVLPRGVVVYLYASSPVSAVVGSFVIADVIRGAKEELWDSFGPCFGLLRSEYDDYFEGCAVATAIRAEEITRIDTPIALARLRSSLNIEPAQNYRYVSETLLMPLRSRAG